ncbi:hypothetical protein M758_UG217200 [Ceratodon purpureus]|nr:hypothetical protein M758_UG217200 [Ceratodon purpureus]
MAIDGHSCEHECDDWVVDDGQAALEDYLRAVHDHNRRLALRNAGVPLPKNHYTGLKYVSSATLLDALPLDVVSNVVWPILMDKVCHLENYRTCVKLRAFSTSWREYVDRQREWTLGTVANERHRHRQPQQTEDSSECSTDYESDGAPDYGLANIY